MTWNIRQNHYLDALTVHKLWAFEVLKLKRGCKAFDFKICLWRIGLFFFQEIDKFKK